MFGPPVRLVNRMSNIMKLMIVCTVFVSPKINYSANRVGTKKDFNNLNNYFYFTNIKGDNFKENIYNIKITIQSCIIIIKLKSLLAQ